MMTGEKKLLRAWALFLPGGIRLQGAHEYTPPAINITTVDIKTGAMDAPVAVDDGMEALTCSFKIYGYDVAMLTLLG
ncbi:phage major tail tube protein, partial [Escherichia coli]